MDETRLESGPDATLLEIVRAAATAARGADRQPVGRLELTSHSDGTSAATLSIEASVSAHGVGWSVEQLDVRVRREQGEPLAAATLIELLERFGATHLTSLTVLHGGDELMDFTLSFASRLPFLATNQLILSVDLSADRLQLCNEVLKILGVRVSSRRSHLQVPRHQLRARPSMQAQAQAFQYAADQTRHAELYVSALPATRAVRVAQNPGRALPVLLDLCISVGLGEGAPTNETAQSMERAIEHAFGLGFSGRSWRVRNTHGQPQGFRAHGSIDERPRRSWSLNWGQRK